MKTYLISLMSGDGPPPPDLTAIMTDLEVVNAEIRETGGWVFAGGLADTSSATTIRGTRQGNDAALTDGWARRIQQATGLPVEVRPFMGDGDPGTPATE